MPSGVQKVGSLCFTAFWFSASDTFVFFSSFQPTEIDLNVRFNLERDINMWQQLLSGIPSLSFD